MKLQVLHEASPLTLREDKKDELLSYVRMMAARQPGVDVDQFMSKVQSMADPEFAARETRKASTKQWAESAKPGEKRNATLYGRKVQVTVLEAALRGMLCEANRGIWGDIARILTKPLRAIFRDEPTETKAVSNALDEFPELNHILRFAKKQQVPVQDDPKFWAEVERIAPGLSQKAKEMAMSFSVRKESIEKEGEKVTLFTECYITEARVSAVMKELGIPQDEIGKLMSTYNIADADYDLERLKKAATAVPRGMVRGAKAARRGLGRMASDSAEQNEDFASSVIVALALLKKTAEAKPQTPEEAAAGAKSAVADIAGTGGTGATGASSVVSSKELSQPYQEPTPDEVAALQAREGEA